MVRLRRRVRHVPQSELAECGAACLAMVLGYHGHHAPLAEVREACGGTARGATALALVRAARAFGLSAEGLRAEPHQLARLALPAVLHWDFDHWCVLERIGRRGAVLVDPATGRRAVTAIDLRRHFTGIALAFAPTPALKRRARARPSLARYRRAIRRALPSLAQVALATVALQVVGLAFPVAQRALVDWVIVPRQGGLVWGLAVALALAVASRTGLSLVRSFVVQGVRARLDAALMAEYVAHLLRLPLGFFLQRDAGDLLERAQANGAVQKLLGSDAVAALLDLGLLAAYAALMLAFDARVGLVIVGFAAARVALLLALRERNALAATAEAAASGREFGALVEALTGLETTRASGAEARLAQRWAQRVAARVDVALDRRRLAAAAAQLTVLLRGLATAAVFLVGGRAVAAERMTLGTLASFLALQDMFLVPLEALLATAAQLQHLGAHLARLDEVLAAPAEASGRRDPGRLRGDIALRDVTFAHAPGAPEVLRGITVSIRAGEKVAIVGPSGAGKSTLARLLLGLHLPTAGSIAFDGHDLRELDLGSVRRQVGVVQQETFLFDDTVRANLSLGCDAAPVERLREAARSACVDHVIAALPDGYDARIGENGAALSGGERQRLSLARALAGDPAILLLDEATSALDLETERRVHRNLAALRCTRVLVAHRLATVRDADRILVLVGGRLVDQGTYDELAARDGAFRTLVAAREVGDVADA